MMVSKNLIIFVLSIIYVSFIFRFLLCFLKLKQGLLQKAAAIAGVWIVGCTVVFPEDPFNVFGMLVLFAMVLLICFEGSVGAGGCRWYSSCIPSLYPSIL